MAGNMMYAGSIASTGSAMNISLGFVPEVVVVKNQNTWTTGVCEFYWTKFKNNASALAEDVQGVHTAITTNGITPLAQDATFSSPLVTITGLTAANPPVVTATNTYSNGDEVTISGVVGPMSANVNGNRYLVSAVSGSAFSLQDLNGNNINGTGFGSYTSGGQANKIAGAGVVGTVQNSAIQGVTLGSSIVGSASDVLFIEAYQSDKGYVQQ